MTCGGCNKSSNFVFMTGIPEDAPKDKYLEFMRVVEDSTFGPDDLEVIYNLLNISRRYQSYCKIRFSPKLLILFLTLNSELLG